MAFVTGGVIKATDYNTNATNLLNLWGTGSGTFGYGQTTNTPPAPAINTLTPSVQALNPTYPIRASDWLAFNEIIGRIGQQTGTTLNLPSNSDFVVGGVIKAYTASGNDLQTLITQITNNAQLAAPSALTTTSGVLTATRTAEWGVGIQQTITHEFTATFANENQARWFFNSGGKILITLSLTGGSSTPQNNSWTNLYAGMGNFILNYNSSSITGSGGTTLNNVGFYQLTSTYQILHVRMPGGSGVFANNQCVVQARVENVVGANGGNGTVIRFQIISVDNTSGTYGGYSVDVIDGDFNSSIGLTRATTYLTVNPPTLVTTQAP